MLLAIVALAIGGCSMGGSPSADKKSLIRRVSIGLSEVGASRALTRCLTAGLGDRLSQADADRAYEDLASDPEVSEKSLNRVSLVEENVKAHLLAGAPRCRAALVARGLYTHAEVDRMLRSVGARGYRQPDLFRLSR